MWPFRKKHPKDALSVNKLFPIKKRREITFNFGIGEAIVAAITSTAVVAGTTAAAVATAIDIVLSMALSIGLSMGLNAIFAKKPSERTAVSNGRIFNTRSVSEPLHLHYGIVKVGGNWVYVDPSKPYNGQFNVAVTWGEGEVEGIAKDSDHKPRYLAYLGIKEGLNDLVTGGLYTGTSARFAVRIDSIGTNDTFKWSTDGGKTWEATGILISSQWHELTDGITCRFGSITGHTLNDAWAWDAGDGYWIGDSLLAFYEGYNFLPVLSGNTNLVAYKTFYTGSSGQPVDGSLSSAEPLWNDPLHYTAYSTFGLTWNDYAWNGIPEFRATLKGLKVYDPRTGTTTWTRNPALVWYDLMTNSRYGLGTDPVRIDQTSVIDAANWCDDNGYYFDGSIIDRDELAGHLEDILRNFRAFVTRNNGVFKLKIYTDDAPVMSLTDVDFDIAGDYPIFQPGIPETPNKVKCTFININKHWAVDFADYYEAAVLAADNGIERCTEMSLTGTVNYLQAKKLAKFNYFRGRFNKTFSINCHPRVLALEEGDMVTITSDYLEWTTEKVRLLRKGIPQEGFIPCVFQEEDPSIYDQAVDLVEDDEIWVSPASDKTADIPTNLLVGVTGPDLSTIYNKDDAIQTLSWDYSGAAVDYVLQWRKSGASNWIEKRITDPNIEGSLVTYDIEKLSSNTVYNWRVRTQLSKSLSEWVDGADFTTWAPTNPGVVTGQSTTLDTIKSADLPADDGTIGYIATSTELQDCDDSTDFSSSATVSDSIVLETDTTYKIEGTGSLKVGLWRYPKVEYFETYKAYAALGKLPAGYYYAQSFELSAGATVSAVAFAILKYEYIYTAGDISVWIYDDSGDYPNSIVATGTLDADDVPESMLAEPKRFTYCVLDAPVALAGSTKYWIVLYYKGNAYKYYSLQWDYAHTWETDPYANGKVIWGETLATMTYSLSYFNDICFRVCVTGDALNKLITATIGATDISLKTYLKNYIRSSRTGAFLSQGIGEAAISDNLFAISVTSANSWELKSSSLATVAAADRDAITKVGWKVTNMDEDAIVYLDVMFANQGDPRPAIRRGTAIDYILTEDTADNTELTCALREDCLNGYNLASAVAGITYFIGEVPWLYGTNAPAPIAGTGGIWRLINTFISQAGGSTELPYVESKNPVIRMREAQYGTGAATRRMGLAGADLTADPSDGIYFRHTNAGNYTAVTRKVGSENTLDTGIAAANGVFHKLKLVVTGTTSVAVYVDEIYIGIVDQSVNNYIPTAGLFASAGQNAVLLNGLDLDYIQVNQDR